MIFLVRRWTEHTATWWDHAAADQHAPRIVHELLRGESAVCERAIADEAMAWAREQQHWSEEAAPLWVRET